MALRAPSNSVAPCKKHARSHLLALEMTNSFQPPPLSPIIAQGLDMLINAVDLTSIHPAVLNTELWGGERKGEPNRSHLRPLAFQSILS